MVEQENEPFICDLNCKLTQFPKHFSQPNITAESSESSGAVQGICFLPFENFHNFPSRSLHRPPLPGPERNRAATCLIAVNWMLNIAPNEFSKKNESKKIFESIWMADLHRFCVKKLSAERRREGERDMTIGFIYRQRLCLWTAGCCNWPVDPNKLSYD